MGEAERIAGSQHVRARELVRRRQRRGGAQPRQLRRQVQRSVVLEHRHTACQRLGVGRQRGKPAQDRARERTGRHLGRRGERRGVGGLRCSIAASSSRSCSGFPAVSSKQRPQNSSSAPGRRRRTSSATAAGPSDGNARTLAEGSPANCRRSPPSPSSPARVADHDADRLVGQASGQIDEKAQGGLVRPVGVVDHEQQRLSFRQPQREPVEGVKDREARPRRRRRPCRPRPRRTARGPALPGRPAARRGPSRATSRAAIARHPIRTHAPARARARGGRRHPRSRAMPAARSSSADFPTPGGPSTSASAPRPAAASSSSSCSTSSSGVTLEQRLGRRRSATGLQVGRHPASIPRTDRVVEPASHPEPEPDPDCTRTVLASRSSVGRP